MAQVLVLAEHDGSEVKKVTFELLTLARRFGDPVLVWAGPGAADAQPRLAEFGAVTVYVSEQPELAEYAVAPVVDLVEKLTGETAPSVVMIASTAEGKEVAGRLAVRTGSGVLTDVVDVGDGLTAEQLNFGGSVIVHSKVKTGTPIITVRSNSIAPEPAAAAAEIKPVEVAAGIDQFGILRGADREAGGDGRDAPSLFLEIPNEFAAGAFLGEGPAVFGEDRDARSEQRAPHCRDDRHPVHKIEHLGRVAVAGAGHRLAQHRETARRCTIGGEILGAADFRLAVDRRGRE